MRNKKFFSTALSLILVSSMLAGCVNEAPSVSTSVSLSQPEVSVSVSKEEEIAVSIEPEQVPKPAPEPEKVSEPEPEPIVIENPKKTPLAVEVPGETECNHRYYFDKIYEDNAKISCQKCGYSPASIKKYDCSKKGHIVFLNNTKCSVCKKTVNYKENELEPIDYKAPTAECDGIVQLTDKDGKNYIISFIAAGHGHAFDIEKKRFNGYKLKELPTDYCIEGERSQYVCAYCKSKIDEPVVIKPGQGRHLQPVIISPANPDDPNSKAQMKCESCGKKYEKALPKRLKLSGNKEDAITTTEYCYIAGDDYLIYIDKDIKLPGDFEDMITDMIKEIRTDTGILTDDWKMPEYDTPSFRIASFIGEDYWDSIPYNNQLIINMLVDRKQEGYVSSAYTSNVAVFEYSFYGDEYWNSMPSLKNKPWLRGTDYNYLPLFHEAAHAITLRTVSSNKMGRILTEGIAQHVAIKIDNKYAEERKGYTPSVDATYDQTDFSVTADNAEKLFKNDYHDLSMEQRGAEYDYGKYLCEFLEETYGSDYFVKIADELSTLTFSDEFFGTDNDRKIRTEAMKKVFGKDVFVKFGKWYQKKK